MTGAAWLQLLALVACIAVGTRLLGPYLAGVFGDDEKALGDRVFLPIERPDLPALRHRPEPRAALEHLRLLAARLQRRLGPRRLRAPALPGLAAPQPHRRRGGARGPLVQHRGQLRDQHELAELRRREDDELPHPDGRADRAELRVGRRRPHRRRRPDPRPGPPPGGDHRQLLGRPRARHGADPAPARRRGRGRARQPGRDPDPAGPGDGHHARAGDPVDPRRPVRQPGGDQGARHQRRRHAQRQLRPPVREPQRLHQPPADGRDPAHPVRPHLRLRADGQGPEAGLGRVRRHVRALGRLGGRRHRLRGRRQPGRRRPRA